MEYVWTLLIGLVLGRSHLIDHVSDRSHISFKRPSYLEFLVFIVLELFIIADYKS